MGAKVKKKLLLSFMLVIIGFELVDHAMLDNFHLQHRSVAPLLT